MLHIIQNSWQLKLEDEFQKKYFLELMQKVSYEYVSYTCYPPQHIIFNAFNLCSFENTKVVILGQDPYHGAGEANGLCFSVNDGIAIPPSLRNIFKEIASDYNTIFVPTNGNLELWAQQGVLLLNSCLTVRKNSPNSHKYLEWDIFTDAVIKLISNEKEHVVFMLWGAFAQKKMKCIDASKHLVLSSGHPSPLSANKGKWFGNKHFSNANTYLEAHKKTAIHWI